MAKQDEHAQVREDVDVSDIPGTGRLAILKRTVKEFQEDNITDWAAALTYYSVLALFPALLALVAIVGLFGQYPQTTNTILDILRNAGAGDSLVDSAGNTINGIVQNKGGAGALLGFGLISTYVFRGNAIAISKGDAIRSKLVSFQVPLGGLAVAMSVVYGVLHFI